MHQPGSVLGGRYRLDQRIALGGMGEVWSGTDTVLDREVAVKVLRTDNPGALVSRFRNEARHMAALSHPGIALIHDYGEDGADAFLVMELVAGDPLSKVLARKEPVPIDVALSYLAQTAEALSAAHAVGVVHRDIKPGNLLILADGSVKVTDFGIARAVDSVATTLLGNVMGTPQYMSPEQAKGEPATPRSDVYSLGVVGYELLAGHRPFVGETPVALAMAHVHEPPPELPESVPADVRELISRSLSKNPDDRPVSAAAFAAEARELQGRLLPSTVAVAGTVAGDPYVADTVAMAAPHADPATEVMPPGHVVGASPELLGRDFVSQERSNRRVIAWTIAVAALLVGAFVVWGLSNDSKPELAGATLPAQTTTAAPGTVAALVPTSVTPTPVPTSAGALVDEQALIGLDQKVATDRLVALGLHVKAQTVKGHGDVRKGTVVGVTPSGQVPPGSTVTLQIGGKR